MDTLATMVKSNARSAFDVREKGRRVAFRQNLGKLRDNVVGETTLKRYDAGLVYFFKFCLLHSFAAPASTYELDQQLHEFVEA